MSGGGQGGGEWYEEEEQWRITPSELHLNIYLLWVVSCNRLYVESNGGRALEGFCRTRARGQRRLLKKSKVDGTDYEGVRKECVELEI